MGCFRGYGGGCGSIFQNERSTKKGPDSSDVFTESHEISRIHAGDIMDGSNKNSATRFTPGNEAVHTTGAASPGLASAVDRTAKQGVETPAHAHLCPCWIWQDNPAERVVRGFAGGDAACRLGFSGSER